MTWRIFILGLVLASAMSCGSGGGSPSDNSNSAGASGSGGNDSPTGGGGGDEGLESVDGTCPDGYALRASDKADGTHRCYPATEGNGGTQAGGDGGNLGNGGESGSAGGDPGTGGDISTGGTGGSEPMMPECPEWVEDMASDSPCLLAGGWTRDVETDLVNGHITITVSPGSVSSQMYTVSVVIDFGGDGLGGFDGNFVTLSIPFDAEFVNEITGEEVSLWYGLENMDYLILSSGPNGNPHQDPTHFFRDVPTE